MAAQPIASALAAHLHATLAMVWRAALWPWRPGRTADRRARAVRGFLRAQRPERAGERGDRRRVVGPQGPAGAFLSARRKSHASHLTSRADCPELRRCLSVNPDGNTVTFQTVRQPYKPL